MSMPQGTKLTQTCPDSAESRIRASTWLACRYLETFDEMMQLMACLHLLGPFPDVIILDSITDFALRYGLLACLPLKMMWHRQTLQHAGLAGLLIGHRAHSSPKP